VQGLDYDVVGNVDADVSFDPDYFSYLLRKLAEDRTLGLVGTPFKEGTNPTYDFDLSVSSTFQALASCSGANISNRSAGMCR
jgi:hypothetical protein